MTEPEDKRVLEIGLNLGCVAVIFIVAVAYITVTLWGH